MTPPISGSFEVAIDTQQQADSLVKNLDEQERKILLDVLHKTGITVEKEEIKEITQEHLLNKPNMTSKDRAGMQKTLDYLVEKKMDTPENLQKLYENVSYGVENGKEYVKVGPIKRLKEDITAKPNRENIFQRNNVTYFQWSENIIKEQNALLAKQGMEIPLYSSYEKSMRSLPGNYSRSNDSYEGGNILALIINISMDGNYSYHGVFYNDDSGGGRWSASLKDNNPSQAGFFSFNKDNGLLFRMDRGTALPIRPILKQS